MLVNVFDEFFVWEGFVYAFHEFVFIVLVVEQHSISLFAVSSASSRLLKIGFQ